MPKYAEAQDMHLARARLHGDRLETNCWCEAAVLLVPARMVKAGLTGSCRRRGCVPPGPCVEAARPRH